MSVDRANNGGVLELLLWVPSSSYPWVRTRPKEIAATWAQVITFRVRSGTEAQVEDMMDHLIATAQPDSDVLKELAMSDQCDPTSVAIAR